MHSNSNSDTVNCAQGALCAVKCTVTVSSEWVSAMTRLVGWLHDKPGTRDQEEDTAVVTHAPDTEDYYGAHCEGTQLCGVATLCGGATVCLSAIV